MAGRGGNNNPTGINQWGARVEPVRAQDTGLQQSEPFPIRRTN